MKHSYLLFFTALMLSACDSTIHQYPKPQNAEVILVPWFKLEPYTAYKEVVYDETWHSVVNDLDGHDIQDQELPDGTKMHVTLDVCNGSMDDDLVHEWQSDIVGRHTLTSNNLTRDYSDTVNINIPEGTYHIAAWADYDSQLYDISSLTAINTNLERFPAMYHLQNAQSGRQEFAIDYQLGPEGYPLLKGYVAKNRVVPIELKRTQGRFIIKSVDMKDYLQGNDINEDIIVKAVFTLYISCGFNVLTNLPNKYISTYQLNVSPKLSDSSEVDILSHYIFTPPDGETTVLADFYLYHADGTLFNTCQDIKIPIKRGGETVVRGHFLTRDIQSHSGMTVDEKFKGEYIVPFEY